jgi:MoaA/NifB/PqqE/SkfB family radical SAM enzyme
VGVKLELTHACNLRCDFCYTDSPRHTIARTADLPDDTWRSVVEQSLELGIVEAVVTGGEPLMRAPLALELIARMADAGVGVTLNTNGWYVDEAVADRLARMPGLTVSISLDGATPELHDGARGVPGSWRRAVRAIGLLLERDVSVVLGHVVTPLNVRWVQQYLEHMWLLGVSVIRVTPVVPVGAASRQQGWDVDRRGLRRTVAATCAGLSEDFRVVVQSGTAEIIATREQRAPAALLVRPSGAVLIDSLHPFAFGRVDEGLDECWRRIVDDWRDPELEQWARGISNTRGLATASVVPYAELERTLGGGSAQANPGDVQPKRRVGRARRARRLRRAAADAPRLPRRGARSTETPAGPGDVQAARAHVLELALSRHYDVAAHRWSGDPDGERIVRVLADGQVCRLNRTAGMVLDSLGGGTVAGTADALAARYPGIPPEQLQLDALRMTRWLGIRRLVRGSPAPAAD